MRDLFVAKFTTAEDIISIRPRAVLWTPIPMCLANHKDYVFAYSLEPEWDSDKKQNPQL